MSHSDNSSVDHPGSGTMIHSGGSAMRSLDDGISLPAWQREVDAQGLNCPLPILRAKKVLAQMASGDVLRVITTDLNAVRDFQAFARQTGNELLAQHQQEGSTQHFLKRR